MIRSAKAQKGDAVDVANAIRSLDELFCKSGYLTGSLPLPKAGDVRMALTTAGGKAAPAALTYQVLTDSTPCPKQRSIIPGFGVGAAGCDKGL